MFVTAGCSKIWKSCKPDTLLPFSIHLETRAKSLIYKSIFKMTCLSDRCEKCSLYHLISQKIMYSMQMAFTIDVSTYFSPAGSCLKKDFYANDNKKLLLLSTEVFIVISSSSLLEIYWIESLLMRYDSASITLSHVS